MVTGYEFTNIFPLEVANVTVELFQLLHCKEKYSKSQ